MSEKIGSSSNIKELLLLDKVNGGFCNWSIGIGESGEIVVEFSRYPNYGAIVLHNASIDELRKISEMFLFAARKSLNSFY